MNDLFDVVVAGAGAAGVSCAWNLAKRGIRTLLVEKNIHAGGLITSGLVMPVMKLNHMDINVDFYNTLVKTAKDADTCITYADGNMGWFNTEKLKLIFDDMLSSVGCNVLYLSNIIDTIYNDKQFRIKIEQDMLSHYIDTNFLVDATGNAKIFRELNLDLLNDNEEKQSTSLRFILSGVNRKIFSEWILMLDSDRNVTTSCSVGDEVHFSTAYTWDTNKSWALRPIFEKAIADNVLFPSDSAYFQVFSMPNTVDSVSFNCPRLINDTISGTGHIYENSALIIEGRRRINRITNFCRRYLPGFEHAYISNIADMLGVRESARVHGKKVFKVEDIISGSIPNNPALASNYPIDVHSDKKNSDILEYTTNTWYLPIEALMSKDYENLFVAGRCLSAEFKAQAAVRTQINCFSMGEAVAKYIAAAS